MGVFADIPVSMTEIHILLKAMHTHIIMYVGKSIKRPSRNLFIAF